VLFIGGLEAALHHIERLVDTIRRSRMLPADTKLPSGA
jgi:hypothetical protein